MNAYNIGVDYVNDVRKPEFRRHGEKLQKMLDAVEVPVEGTIEDFRVTTPTPPPGGSPQAHTMFGLPVPAAPRIQINISIVADGTIDQNALYSALGGSATLVDDKTGKEIGKVCIVSCAINQGHLYP